MKNSFTRNKVFQVFNLSNSVCILIVHGKRIEILSLKNQVFVCRLYNDPPEIPDEEFNVCEDPDFKCKWVTEDGEVLDEVTEDQRETCLEVAATVRVSDEVHMTVGSWTYQLSSC